MSARERGKRLLKLADLMEQHKVSGLSLPPPSLSVSRSLGFSLTHFLPPPLSSPLPSLLITSPYRMNWPLWNLSTLEPSTP